MRGRLADLEAMSAIGLLLVLLPPLALLFTRPYPAFSNLLQHLGKSFGVYMLFALSGILIARDLLPRLSETGNPSSTSGGLADLLVAAHMTVLARFLTVVGDYLASDAGLLAVGTSACIGIWQMSIERTSLRYGTASRSRCRSIMAAVERAA